MMRFERMEIRQLLLHILTTVGEGAPHFATRDRVWSTGTVWGFLVFGWAQLFSVYLGGKSLFSVATVMAWGWLAFVLVKTVQNTLERAAARLHEFLLFYRVLHSMFSLSLLYQICD